MKGASAECRWERRPEERPEELLQAALETFARKGYGGTRLEEVAAAAGVSKATVYHYFEGKEDLLRQAIRSRLRASFSEAEAHLEEMDAPASVRLRWLMRRGWEIWLTDSWGRVTRLVIGLASELPGLFELWAREGPLEGWGAVERLIEEGKEGGEFRKDVDAKVAARLMISAFTQQALLHVHYGIGEIDPCDMDRMFDSGMELYMAALRTRAGGEA